MDTNQNEYYDAFISYRHSSGFYMANLIYEKLVYNGYRVFLDKNLRSEETSYENQIKTAIQNSSNFIMILFNGDLDKSSEDGDWLKKEADWAYKARIHRIPLLCEGYKPGSDNIPFSLKKTIIQQGIDMHKDNALDKDIDLLCAEFLKNVNPVRPIINTADFFKNNLNRQNVSVKRVDLAFHAGRSWRSSTENKPILDEILQKNIPVRILINTPEAAESIAKHMRDKEADYKKFAEMQDSWKTFSIEHKDLIEVRVCSIPLLRVYHAIEFKTEKEGQIGMFDRIHVKYYAYKNYNLNDSFEHEMSSFSKYYEIYKNEFEYLWDQSEKL